jgi:signal transduction histidine kinase
VDKAAETLLDAVSAISSDLDLRSVLGRLVEAASRLTGARYAALGVIGADGLLVEFVTTGIDAHVHEQIGDLPRGRGILGLLIREPETIRIKDLTAHPASTGFPPHHPPMGSFLGVPVRIRGTVFGNLYLTEKQGAEEFTLRDEQLVQALARTAGFVIENARAYGRSERRRQWLEATAELTEALQPPVDLDDALRAIASTVRSVSGARVTAVLGSTAADPVLVIDGDPAERPTAQAALEQVVAELDLDGSDPGVDSAVDPVDLVAQGFTATVVPLRAHLAHAGALVALFDGPDTRPDADERELLAAFADQAGLALDRAQAVADREELAVISDRERIARDLHDVVIQRLFATGLQLQALATTTDSTDLAARLERAVDELDVTIKAIRGTIFELQHREADSLRAEIRSLVREYVPVLGFAPAVVTSGPIDTRVPDEVREQLLPVLREAVSNVARHSLANEAHVEVHVGAAELRLTVIDHGVGLAEDRHESGLGNVRRRAEALGGVMELDRTEPSGTTLVWRVPLGSGDRG